MHHETPTRLLYIYGGELHPNKTILPHALCCKLSAGMQVHDGHPGDVWESQLICSLRQQTPTHPISKPCSSPRGVVT